MPSLLIKINEPRNSETLELDHVRPGYIFRWEEAYRAYVYRPKNQAEIDSIFGAQRIYRNVWAFVPLVVDDAAPASPAKNTVEQVAALQAELDRANELLSAATKRIDQLKGAQLAADQKSAKRIADLEAGLAKVKAEYDKLAAATEAALATPKPAKAKPGRPPRKRDAEGALVPDPAPPVPLASTGSAEEAPPAE